MTNKQLETIYEFRNISSRNRIHIEEIRNNILNNFGGVKEFIKDYGGDYFDEEYVNWFMKVEDYNDERLDGFKEKWNLCFPL